MGLLGGSCRTFWASGYDYVDRVLGGNMPVKAMLLLVVLKMVATPVCYSSGNAGGIFGPACSSAP